MEEICLRLTAGEIVDLGYWQEFCSTHGIKEDILSEEIVDRDEVFKIWKSCSPELYANILKILSEE